MDLRHCTNPSDIINSLKTLFQQRGLCFRPLSDFLRRHTSSSLPGSTYPAYFALVTPGSQDWGVGTNFARQKGAVENVTPTLSRYYSQIKVIVK